MAKDGVVKTAQEAFAFLYRDTCTISESQQVLRPNGTTTEAWEMTAKDIPCRVSYGGASIGENGLLASSTQSVKLFLAPDVYVTTGSRILVTREGRTSAYRASTKPALYPTHQEILLSREEVT